jgi:signal transduction histidine kinase
MRLPWRDHGSSWASLRIRLTLWNTAVVLLMTAATLVAARFAARATLYADADAELRSAVSEIVFAVRDLSPDIGAVLATIARKAESHEQRGWFVHVLTEDGTSLWRNDHCPAEVIEFPPRNLDRDENVVQVGPYRYVRHRIVREEGPALHVRLGTYTTGLDDSLSSLVRLLAGVGVVLCVLTPLAGWWLARRATHPVAAMLRTAEALKPERLGDRLGISGSGDELDLLAVTINRLLDDVAAHVDRQERFVADAAHELRGPLAAMRAAVEVAISRERTADDYRETLIEVLEAAQSLTTLANALLTLAATGADHHEIPPGIVDVGSIGRQTASMFAGVAEERNLALHIEADDGAIVPGDASQLRQLVGNLIDNAMRFTAPGGTVRLSVSRPQTSEEIVITVADTGCGIPTEHLARVFDRFFKVDRARTRDAATRTGGLGLAICKVIVDSHRGRISIDSLPGHGTIVTVRLPAATACPALA